MWNLVACLSLTLGLASLEAQGVGEKGWKLRWSDEFAGAKGSAPDAQNWGYDTGAGGWGNGELETYCAVPSDKAPCSAATPNAYLDGAGHLVLKAIHTGDNWTSARLLTRDKHAFRYGRIEARMKLPVGAGFWPAFWMLGADIEKTGWPAAGEQDIMEWVQKYGAGATSSTVHGPGYSGAKGISTEAALADGGRIDDAGFHTYGVVWAENSLAFYRDDWAKPFVTLTPASLPAGSQWVFNRPFFILLNFAIGGGGFPGLTNASTPRVGETLVDYVRVYEPAQ